MCTFNPRIYCNTKSAALVSYVCLIPFCQKECVFTVLSTGCQSPFLFYLNCFLSLFTHSAAQHRFYFLAAFRLQHLYISRCHFSGHSQDIVSLIIDISSFYFIALIFISPVIQQLFSSKFHCIYVIFRASLQLKPPCLAAFSQSVCQLR